MAQIYRSISRIFPQSIIERVKTILYYSSINVDSEIFIGFMVVSTVLSGLGIGFVLGIVFNTSFFYFFIGTTILLNISIYLWIMALIDKKTKLIEESLPEALQLMASNLKAGMTPEKAFLISSLPEFGPLKEEIDIVGRKIILGQSVGHALIEMSKRIKSKRLSRTIELVNSGLESGGSLATLLEATATDLHDQFLIDKKIKATITMYVIFIFSAASIITPILFGLSSFLVEVIRSSISQVDIGISSIPIKVSQVQISQKFLLIFISSFIIINCIMASSLLGLISAGKQRYGVRFLIPMLLLAIPCFLLARYMIQTLMSSLFGL